MININQSNVHVELYCGISCAEIPVSYVSVGLS